MDQPQPLQNDYFINHNYNEKIIIVVVIITSFRQLYFEK